MTFIHIQFIQLTLLSFLLACYISNLKGCSPPDVSNSVKVAQDTYVCVTLGPLNWNLINTTGSFLRTATKLKADTLGSVKVNGAWTSPDYQNDTLIQKLGIQQNPMDGLAVSVESMGTISYQKLYRTVDASSNATITYPILMAIINVDQGKVKTIVWDDDCKWCSSSRCQSNTYDYFGDMAPNTKQSCWIPDGECIYGTNGTAIIPNDLCELRVYITWTGTDENGYFFTSAASRFSRMAQTEMTDFTNRLQDASAE